MSNKVNKISTSRSTSSIIQTSLSKYTRVIRGYCGWVGVYKLNGLWNVKKANQQSKLIDKIPNITWKRSIGNMILMMNISFTVTYLVRYQNPKESVKKISLARKKMNLPLANINASTK